MSDEMKLLQGPESNPGGMLTVRVWADSYCCPFNPGFHSRLILWALSLVFAGVCLLTWLPEPSSCARWSLSVRCAASPSARPPPCWETLSHRCSQSPLPGAAPHLSTSTVEKKTGMKQKHQEKLNLKVVPKDRRKRESLRVWGWNFLPSTREVSSVTLAAFLRPAGRLRPNRSSFSRRHRPPFLDFALEEKWNLWVFSARSLWNHLDSLRSEERTAEVF